ncbi:MAG TPA: hypothetical protein P5114_02030 [Hyphomicrobiaceae bacterium]|nr:hypothetical protein [Hyphomicrobiaceae bacterium]
MTVVDGPEIKELTSLLRRLESVKAPDPLSARDSAQPEIHTVADAPEEGRSDDDGTLGQDLEPPTEVEVSEKDAEQPASIAQLSPDQSDDTDAVGRRTAMAQEIAELAAIRSSLPVPIPKKPSEGLATTVLAVSLAALISMAATLYLAPKFFQPKSDDISITRTVRAEPWGTGQTSLLPQLPDQPNAASLHTAPADFVTAQAGKINAEPTAANARSPATEVEVSTEPPSATTAPAITSPTSAPKSSDQEGTHEKLAGLAEPSTEAANTTAPAAVSPEADAVAVGNRETEMSAMPNAGSKDMLFPLFVPEHWIVPPNEVRQLPFVLAAVKTSDYRVIVVGLEEDARLANAINIDAGIWMLNGENLADAQLERGKNPPANAHLVIELRKTGGELIGRRRVLLSTSSDASN